MGDPMPLDATSTSARSELAALNDVIRSVSAERDVLQAKFEPLVGPAQQLLALIAQHRIGLKAIADEPDDQVYTAKLLELRDLERQIDRLQPTVDMAGYKDAEYALQQANSRVAALGVRHSELVFLAAQEAVERYLEAVVIPAYAQAIQVRGIADLIGRAIEARGYGTNPSSVALHIGQQILDRVASIIPAIRVPGDREAAEQFLARLADDPSS